MITEAHAIAIIQGATKDHYLWTPRCHTSKEGQFYWTLPTSEMSSATESLRTHEQLRNELRAYLLQDWGLRADVGHEVLVDRSRPNVLDIYFACTVLEDRRQVPNRILPHTTVFDLAHLPSQHVHLRHKNALVLISTRDQDIALLQVERPGILSPIVIEDSEHRLDRGTISVDLGIELDDIPEPRECEFCGHQMQREFLVFEDAALGVEVFVTRVPGYGCTGCGIKEWDEDVIAIMRDRIVDRARILGEEQVAAHYEQILAPHAAAP